MKKQVLCLLIFLTYATLLAQIPSNGLVGRWEFSGNANDGSPTANNGTVTGAVLTTDRCGNANSAYSFNGTGDYIGMSLAGPSGSAPRSVSFWAKTSKSTISPNDIMAVFGYGEFANAKGFSLHYNYNCVGVGCDVHDQAYTKAAPCLTDNNWHHVAVVFNSSVSAQYGTMTYYVDGVALSSSSCVITGTNQTVNTGTVLPVNVGKVHDANARYFQGSLDDFYLYNRVLSPAEVQQLYYACLPSISGSTIICRNAQGYVYSVPPIPGATSYTWTLPNGWTGTSNTNTILAIPGTGVGSGTMQVAANSSCGGLNQLSAIKTIMVVSDCVGLESNALSDPKVLVFPNPVNSREFTVQIPVNSTISIHNALGQIVQIMKLQSGTNQINLREFGKGIYFVRMPEQQSFKVIKLIYE